MADDGQDEWKDRRSHPRQRTVRAAITRFEGLLSPIPCVMLDISRGGARLHLHNPHEVPDQFQLHLESENSLHKCEVVWRSANEIGVKFVT